MAAVLIVEDEGLLALDVKEAVERETGARVHIAASVKRAQEVLGREPDVAFVLLDVEVLDGTTFGFARDLCRRQTPFAFASASDRRRVPEDLRGHVFIPKPYDCRLSKVIEAVRQGGTGPEAHACTRTRGT